jgi:TonB family protein
MRNSVRFLVSTFLACSVLLLCRMQAQSLQPNQTDTSTELTKVCSQKNAPPCATPPRPIYSPPPEYSAQARKAGYQGVCTLGVIVEANGRTSHITVLRSLGMGLDEKAIEAVKVWKYAPALRDGKPVPVQIAVEIAFHLYAGH